MQQCTPYEGRIFADQYSSVAPFGDFYAFPRRGLQEQVAPAEPVPDHEVEFFVISANSEVFNLKFMDQDWPAALPSLGNSHSARSIYIASMRHIRHNHPFERTFLRRDSGGWIKIQDLPQFFVSRDMAPINEYVTRNGHSFGNPAVAAMGAYIACVSGESGNRISILMAVRAIAKGGGYLFREYLRPIAIRASGGTSDQNQKFLRESRFNLRVTSKIMRNIPGLFHITTEDAWGTTASKPEYIFQRLAAKKDDATLTF